MNFSESGMLLEFLLESNSFRKKKTPAEFRQIIIILIILILFRISVYPAGDFILQGFLFVL